MAEKIFVGFAVSGGGLRGRRGRQLAAAARDDRRRRRAAAAGDSPAPKPQSATASAASANTAPPRRRDPYEVLGLEERRSLADEREVRRAYLQLARRLHPDAPPPAAAPDGGDGEAQRRRQEEFDELSRAYELLSDAQRRKIFDDLGYDGVDALDTVRERARNRSATAGIDPLELEMMVEMDGASMGYLEMAEGIDDGYDPEKVGHEDACPRSVEEGIWNVRNHESLEYRYYAAWWLTRFKVREAEKTLVEILQTRDAAVPENHRLRRRIVIAVGQLAATSPVRLPTMLVLGEALHSDDYNMRYNAAEALGRIGDRNGGAEGVPSFILEHIERQLREGAERFRHRAEGELSQESLFDFDALPADVAERVRGIMRRRAEDNEREGRFSRSVGVNVSDMEQPWEKLIKAAAHLRLFHLRDAVQVFLEHPAPLVMHAARKFMFCVSGDATLAETLCEQLQYGVDSAITQNVLCLDIGDIGYIPGARRLVECVSAASSLKMLGLKKMLERNECDYHDPQLRYLFDAMDDLIIS